MNGMILIMLIDLRLFGDPKVNDLVCLRSGRLFMRATRGRTFGRASRSAFCLQNFSQFTAQLYGVFDQLQGYVTEELSVIFRFDSRRRFSQDSSNLSEVSRLVVYCVSEISGQGEYRSGRRALRVERDLVVPVLCSTTFWAVISLVSPPARCCVGSGVGTTPLRFGTPPVSGVEEIGCDGDAVIGMTEMLSEQACSPEGLDGVLISVSLRAGSFVGELAVSGSG